MTDGREPSRRLEAVVTALELLFVSDAYDSVYGLTPRALSYLNAVFKKFNYRLEKVK